MLEYLLDRPTDAPLFRGADLQFLVMDEAHAYRGAQATEVAMLLRRVKDRLAGSAPPLCVATSATLGNPDDPASLGRVTQFASDFFGEPFGPESLIFARFEEPSYGNGPTTEMTPGDYRALGPRLELVAQQGEDVRDKAHQEMAKLLLADLPFRRVRESLAVKPRLMADLATAAFGSAESDIDALLSVASAVCVEGRPLLPTRLHYFVRPRSGLFACISRMCPGRSGDIALIVPRRRDGTRLKCRECERAGSVSILVEVAGCRGCGWLYGVLRGNGTGKGRYDAEIGEPGENEIAFVLSRAGGLPAPDAGYPELETSIVWCTQTGAPAPVSGSCACESQDAHTEIVNLSDYEEGASRGLSQCLNCDRQQRGAVDPASRFAERPDEVGKAMAVALRSFSVRDDASPSQVLVFTDNRQRAATFPPLLEEWVFENTTDRVLTKRAGRSSGGVSFLQMAEELTKSGPELPASRLTEFVGGEITQGHRASAWRAHLYALAIRASGYRDAEEAGLITVGLDAAAHSELVEGLKAAGRKDSWPLAPDEFDALARVIVNFMRALHAVTLPDGVGIDDPAFAPRRPGFVRKGTGDNQWWRDTTTAGLQQSRFEDFMQRSLGISPSAARLFASATWAAIEMVTVGDSRNPLARALPFERLVFYPVIAPLRCDRCGLAAGTSLRDTCTRRGCRGTVARPSKEPSGGVWERWLSAYGESRIGGIRASEHTAQLSTTAQVAAEEDFRAGRTHLLSSTTTFEMGVDLGNLNLVLMRNAPITSAQYIQRAGRAGRGAVKDAVCVTICSGRAWDRDVWEDPLLLMQGRMFPPAVFIDNDLLLPRHIAAEVLAAPLRASWSEKHEPVFATVVTELLEGEAQDFFTAAWPEGGAAERVSVSIDDLTPAAAASLLGPAVTELAERLGRAAEGNLDQQGRVLVGVSRALECLRAAVYQERERLARIGREASALNQWGDEDARKSAKEAATSVLREKLIQHLGRIGALPRYAFPLDAVTLQTSRRWRQSDDGVELARDRVQAIVEYAPGQKVSAQKRSFESGGLYLGRGEQIPPARFMFRCHTCLKTTIRDVAPSDDTRPDCCNNPPADSRWEKFIEPRAFAVIVDESGRPKAPPIGRATMLRSSQTPISIIEGFGEAEFSDTGTGFQTAYRSEVRLVKFNLGQGGKKFDFCEECGAGRASGFRKSRSRSHKPLKGGRADCRGRFSMTQVLLGAVFSSPAMAAQVMIQDGARAGGSSLRAAIHRAACSVLGIDLRDLGVVKSTHPNDVVLYDRAPGGSGFAAMAFSEWPEVVREAKRIIESCRCESACYGCLKTPDNSEEHEALDRHELIEMFKAASSATGRAVNVDPRRSVFQADVEAALRLEIPGLLGGHAVSITHEAPVGPIHADLMLETRDGRLAIECDGGLFHASPEQQEDDARRDRIYAGANVAAYRISQSRWRSSREEEILAVAEVLVGLSSRKTA